MGVGRSSSTRSKRTAGALREGCAGSGSPFFPHRTQEAEILQRTASSVVMEWLKRLFGMGARS